LIIVIMHQFPVILLLLLLLLQWSQQVKEKIQEKYRKFFQENTGKIQEILLPILITEQPIICISFDLHPFLTQIPYTHSP